MKKSDIALLNKNEVTMWSGDRVVKMIKMLTDAGLDEKLLEMVERHNFDVVMPPAFVNEIKELIFENGIHEKDRSAQTVLKCDCGCKFPRWGH